MVNRCAPFRIYKIHTEQLLFVQRNAKRHNSCMAQIPKYTQSGPIEIPFHCKHIPTTQFFYQHSHFDGLSPCAHWFVYPVQLTNEQVMFMHTDEWRLFY